MKFTKAYRWRPMNVVAQDSSADDVPQLVGLLVLAFYLNTIMTSLAMV